MAVISHTLWLPRRGSVSAEYEDAAAADDTAGRYAVADGASEGCFTGLWATLLVDDFVRRAGRGMDEWPDSLSAVQELWDADVRGRRLPYHAQPSVRQGAYATFLGVVLTSSGQPSYQWQALAVGDACLFHTRRGDVLRAFPVERSQDFGNAPALVGARMAADDVRKRQPVVARRPRAARRSPLGHDRCLGAMVSGRAGKGRQSLGRTGIAFAWPAGRPTFRRVDRRTPHRTATAQRRRDAAGHPFGGVTRWTGPSGPAE